MKLGRTTIGALATTTALLAGGLGLALPANAAVTPAAAHSPKYVVLNCSGKPGVKPRTIELACADDGLGLGHLHWTTGWTRHGAAGHGTFWEKLCKPNCAEGGIETMRAKVTLHGSAAVKGHPGDRQYTRLTAIFPGKRPTVYKSRHGKIVATHPRSETFHI
jgi:hypothetical protein